MNHWRRLSGGLSLLLGLLLLVNPRAAAPRERSTSQAEPLRARYLITVADDFVVDVYHNGKAVPDARRTLLEERHGATVERIDVQVHKGDWLVFNVVNNRMRWGGVYYFGVAGCYGPSEFGFQSRLDTGAWSACDNPREADRFISERRHLRHRSAQPVQQPWSDGTPLMRSFAGSAWDGTPLWGSARNTWIKVVVE